jgi:1,4-alpha-glucan branching enzyme
MISGQPNLPLPFGSDPYLVPFQSAIRQRKEMVDACRLRLAKGRSLVDESAGHDYFGLHRTDQGWEFREWAPNASAIYMYGDFSNWREDERFHLKRLANGVWHGRFPAASMQHGQRYRLRVSWPGGQGDRIPAYATRTVQSELHGSYDAEIWAPERPFTWQHAIPPPPSTALIYEAHVGMGQEEERVGTYDEFRRDVLPRVADAGYNTIQLMAIAEHPYYGSFGYHVSSFFAVSSRFGTPDEFRALVDAAHGLGLRIIIDLVHSHSCRNEVEGLSRFDGTLTQYFHDGGRGEHPAWDSRCFDYAKPEVQRFLLSNCRFWLDAYHVDGYRFDGVTSMLYRDHGLGRSFGDYGEYFGGNVDLDAFAYLALANEVIHTVRPDATTIAEEVSGMPGLAAPLKQGGAGFDYRLAMGVTDYWFRLLDQPDESWSMGGMWHEVTNRRDDERCISYVECHDQALVGGQTCMFRLAGTRIYDAMHVGSQSMEIDRAMAIHKLARLVTLATAGHGYLNFMGNEFGHPEWVDFPREGNNWSYHHARRQWSLRDREDLRFRFLAEFDRALVALVRSRRIHAVRPELVLVHEDRKLLAFRRGRLLFLVNLHITDSYPNLPIPAEAGRYDLVLDTDAACFGGHGRVEPGQQYFTEPVGSDAQVRVYLPNRCALVLELAK